MTLNKDCLGERSTDYDTEQIKDVWERGRLTMTLNKDCLGERSTDYDTEQRLSGREVN